MADHQKYRRGLHGIFKGKTEQGRTSVTVTSGELMDAVVGGTKHQPTLACSVMWMEVAQGKATVEFSPASGQGKRLKVRYGLPRTVSPLRNGVARVFADPESGGCYMSSCPRRPLYALVREPIPFSYPSYDLPPSRDDPGECARSSANA